MSDKSDKNMVTIIIVGLLAFTVMLIEGCVEASKRGMFR